MNSKVFGVVLVIMAIVVMTVHSETHRYNHKCENGKLVLHTIG